jgi:WD40 repeat protein
MIVWGAVVAVSIIADGRRVISGFNDKTCILWDLESGRKLAMFLTSSSIRSIDQNAGVICLGSSFGDIYFLQASKKLLNPGLGIVTARKIWISQTGNYMPFSIDCPFCGYRFFLPQKVFNTINILYTINIITKEAGLNLISLPVWNCRINIGSILDYYQSVRIAMRN